MSIFALIFAALIYCHRFLGRVCLETDLIANISYRLNEAQLRLDYNPYQWSYSSWMPFNGLHNPLIQGVGFLIKRMGWGGSEVGQAYLINFLISWLLLSGLSISVYYFFRECGRTKLGALLGATLVTYTGFHLTGVRLFNHMYLLSWIAVCPVFLAFNKISCGDRKLYHALWASLWIGLSLLGGSNTPLFYYIPCFFFLPFFRAGWKWGQVLSVWGHFGLSVIIGILVGSATVLPGIYFLGDTNRSNLKFVDLAFSLNPWEQFQSLLLRDWWWNRGAGYYESDCFLSIAGLVLCVIGFRRGLARYRSPKGIEYTLALCFFASILVLNLSLLPGFFNQLIAFVFESLSIRNSSRFFMLMLLPLGYLAAKGFDGFKEQSELKSLVLSLICFVMVVIFSFNPETGAAPVASKIAFGVSTAFGMAFLGLLYRGRSFKYAPVLLYISFFSIFLFAPNIYTNYSATLRLKKPQSFRKELISFLSFRSDYDKNIRLLERYLLNPPDYLPKSSKLKGKIFDPQETQVLRTNYFATRTQHSLAFTGLHDMASSKRLREYFGALTEPMKDLYGICHELRMGPLGIQKLWHRKSCLADGFLLTRLVGYDADELVMNWLHQSSTQTLSQFAALNCKGLACRGISPKLFEEIGASSPSKPFLKVNLGTAQRPKFKITNSQDAMLFLSIPYRRDWKARVNGQATGIYRLNHAFMGVPIPAGNNEVELFLDNWILGFSNKLSLSVFFVLFCNLLYQSRIQIFKRMRPYLMSFKKVRADFG